MNSKDHICNEQADELQSKTFRAELQSARSSQCAAGCSCRWSPGSAISFPGPRYLWTMSSSRIPGACSASVQAQQRTCNSSYQQSSILVDTILIAYIFPTPSYTFVSLSSDLSSLDVRRFSRTSRRLVLSSAWVWVIFCWESIACVSTSCSNYRRVSGCHTYFCRDLIDLLKGNVWN